VRLGALPSVHMRAFCWSALYMGLRSQLHKLEGLRKLAVTASHRASPISADTKTRWRPSESGVSSRRRLAGITRLMGPIVRRSSDECPFGSFSRHNGPFASCPLYPQSRTLGGASKSALTRPKSPKSAHYALPSDLRGAHTSKSSPVRSKSEGSSFSGLFTL
jgi:hypothetical protein